MNQVTITEENLPLIWRCFHANSDFAVHMRAQTRCSHKGKQIPHGLKMLLDARKMLKGDDALLKDDKEMRKAYEKRLRNYFAMPSFIEGETLLEYLVEFKKELKKLSQM